MLFMLSSCATDLNEKEPDINKSGDNTEQTDPDENTVTNYFVKHFKQSAKKEIVSNSKSPFRFEEDIFDSYKLTNSDPTGDNNFYKSIVFSKKEEDVSFIIKEVSFYVKSRQDVRLHAYFGLFDLIEKMKTIFLSDVNYRLPSSSFVSTYYDLSAFQAKKITIKGNMLIEEYSKLRNLVMFFDYSFLSEDNEYKMIFHQLGYTIGGNVKNYGIELYGFNIEVVYL